MDDAPLSGKVAEQLALPSDPAPKLIPPDYNIVGALQGPTSEWWKKHMSRA